MHTKRFVIFLLLFTAALALPAGASALEWGNYKMTFTVLDEDGLPQRGATVFRIDSQGNEGGEYITSENGMTTKMSVNPGDTVMIRRGQSDSPGPNGYGCSSIAESSPEGRGLTYRVPGQPPANATIIVKKISDPDYVVSTPGDTSDERGLIGLINDERVRLGLGRAEVSATLRDAADRYATYLARNYHQGQPFHCALYDPSTRVMGTGFHGNSGEIVVWTKHRNASSAYSLWRNSPGHYAAMTLDYATVIGAGSAEANGIRFYVAYLGSCRSELGCERTGDYGDSALAESQDETDNPEGPSGNDGTVVPTRLRSLRVRIRGQQMIARYRFSTRVTAQGARVGRPRSGGRPVRFRGSGRRVMVRSRVSRGIWKIVLRYETASGQSRVSRARIMVRKDRSGHLRARVLTVEK